MSSETNGIPQCYDICFVELIGIAAGNVSPERKRSSREPVPSLAPGAAGLAIKPFQRSRVNSISAVFGPVKVSVVLSRASKMVRKLEQMRGPADNGDSLGMPRSEPEQVMLNEVRFTHDTVSSNF